METNTTTSTKTNQEQAEAQFVQQMKEKLNDVDDSKASGILTALKQTVIQGEPRREKEITGAQIASYLVSRLPEYEQDYLYKRILKIYAKQNPRYHRPEKDDSVIMKLLGPIDRKMKPIKQLKSMKRDVLPKVLSFVVEGDSSTWGKVGMMLFPSGLKQKIEDEFDSEVEDVSRVFKVDGSEILRAVMEHKIDRKKDNGSKSFIFSFKDVLVDFAGRHVRPGLVPLLTEWFTSMIGLTDDPESEEDVNETFEPESGKNIKQSDEQTSVSSEIY